MGHGDPGWLITDVQIPAQADFSSQGSILTPGAGEWDARFPHGTPGPVIEMDGTHYLYYVGADGDRDGTNGPNDGGPANRAVGVATSSDLSSWTKSASNPIIPWSDLQSNDDSEEGAWRLAGFNDGGTIVLYVTDLVGSGGGVNGDIRLFTSTDGVSFTDQGIVIAHDGSLPGDDEKGCLGAWKSDGGTVYVGYAAKGTDVTGWEFHIAEGDARDSFTDSTQVLTGQDYGHGTDPVVKSESNLLWMVGENGGEFYAYDPARSDPPSFGTAEETYTSMIDDQFALFLDRDGSMWHLYGAMGTQGDATSVDHWTASVQEV